MNIEKLNSGKWRIRQTFQGKTYRETLDHKPTKKEAMELISKIIEADSEDVFKINFEDAVKNYLKIKSNVLSPSTKRGYTSIQKQFSKRFNSLKLINITVADVQKEVNNYAATHSAKSTANFHGFLSAVLKEFRPSLKLYTKLPQKEQDKGGYVPTFEEVSLVIENIPDKHKIGIKLAALGLRRSEICGIKKEDLDENGMLHIHRAYVQGEDKKWHLRETNKTATSTRTIKLPDDLAMDIRDLNRRGRIYPYHPQSLYRALVETQNRLDIPHFKLHALRAFYASYLHSINIPDSYIQKAGGWKTDYVMKNIYRKTLTDIEKEMMDKSIAGLANLYKS